ncbi:MAG: energy transducer TonB [Holophagaceae bacterium]|nr:energy transducer TonB [Holophagaceae bacterium]
MGGPSGGVVGGVGTAAVVPPCFDAAYLQNPEPGYPLLSKRLGEEGRVILRVLVNPEGLAEKVEVRQSSGHARLDQAALGTVRRWRFTPARRGAERLAAWVLVPLSFQLDA